MAAAADARVTRVERLAMDSELVSDTAATEGLRRLRAGSTSSRSWKLSVIMSSAVSSSSAVRRLRLEIEVCCCFGCSAIVEEVMLEDVDVGAVVLVFVRVLLRCDCFALVFVLVLVVLALAVEEGPRSEPMVAVVETLLNEECVDVSLVMDVVDPMEFMVEVLWSPVGFGTLLCAEVEAMMESSMSAMA